MFLTTLLITMQFLVAESKELLEFKGRTVNGQKEGYGMLYYQDGGMFYRGNFEANKMHGDGELFYPDGRIYEGTFSNGSPLGAGKIYFQDGRNYQGEVKNGLPHGYGSLDYKNGQRYVGNWINGLMDGYGYMKYQDADYEGYWKNGAKNGKGQFTTVDGISCRGIFDNGQLNGYGTCSYRDGSSYRGNWNNGIEQGQGVMITRFGTRINGIWNNGSFKSGWITKSNGDVYYYDSEQDELEQRLDPRLSTVSSRRDVYNNKRETSATMRREAVNGNTKVTNKKSTIFL